MIDLMVNYLFMVFTNLLPVIPDQISITALFETSNMHM